MTIESASPRADSLSDLAAEIAARCGRRHLLLL